MSTEQPGLQPHSTQTPADISAIIDRVGSQWKSVVGIVVVIGIAFGAYWWYTTSEAEKSIEAMTHLSRIQSTFDAGDFNSALTAENVPPVGADKVLGLLEISETYSGTDAGAIAALMAGNSLLNTGKPDEASAQFEKARSSSSKMIEVGAMQGLAAIKEGQGDHLAAADLYEKAALVGDKSGLDDRCLYLAALCFEKAGNKEKAIKIYTLVVKKYEMTEVAALGQAGLARLGMAID